MNQIHLTFYIGFHNEGASIKEEKVFHNISFESLIDACNFLQILGHLFHWFYNRNHRPGREDQHGINQQNKDSILSTEGQVSNEDHCQVG